MSAVKTIIYSSHFERVAKKMPAEILEEVREREEIFRRDCFDPILRTHKLKGRHQDLWSFSITYKHRISFRFITADVAYFIDVGDHSIYQ